MSVFTPVTPDELTRWLQDYSVGTLLDLKGIAAGIENTNYFVTTTHGRYVLTLFEKLSREELPFYIHLMAHLSQHGIPCPAPIANRDNHYLGTLNGKPAALVTRLQGASIMAPDAAHCAAIGGMLGDMHVAGQSYPRRLDNPRGARWWAATTPEVLPFLPPPEAALLEQELAFQLAQQPSRAPLPAGVVHADLFRDNCLFDDEGGMARVGGIIDFYFAGHDALLFDLAVTVNDWCSLDSGALDPDRAGALIDAYFQTRPLTDDERRAWPAMLRAAALRFWLSRLYDFHLPRAGEMVHRHDPTRFRDILQHRIDTPHLLISP